MWKNRPQTEGGIGLGQTLRQWRQCRLSNNRCDCLVFCCCVEAGPNFRDSIRRKRYRFGAGTPFLLMRPGACGFCRPSPEAGETDPHGKQPGMRSINCTDAKACNGRQQHRPLSGVCRTSADFPRRMALMPSEMTEALKVNHGQLPRALRACWWLACLPRGEDLFTIALEASTMKRQLLPGRRAAPNCRSAQARGLALEVGAGHTECWRSRSESRTLRSMSQPRIVLSRQDMIGVSCCHGPSEFVEPPAGPCRCLVGGTGTV